MSSTHGWKCRREIAAFNILLRFKSGAISVISQSFCIVVTLESQLNCFVSSA